MAPSSSSELSSNNPFLGAAFLIDPPGFPKGLAPPLLGLKSKSSSLPLSSESRAGLGYYFLA